MGPSPATLLASLPRSSSGPRCALGFGPLTTPLTQPGCPFLGGPTLGSGCLDLPSVHLHGCPATALLTYALEFKGHKHDLAGLKPSPARAGGDLCQGRGHET